MQTIKGQMLVVAIIASLWGPVQAQEKTIRLGIIGLDTSHVVHFTRYINDPNHATGCRVVAAYPGGSADIPASADRVEQYTETLRDEFAVAIVASIEALCERVDGVLLESVDGRPHLAQVRPVFAAGKPVFIDKPVAGNLADAWEIFRLAKDYDVPCWSSSSLRFSPGILGMRSDKRVGEVLGCTAYGPCAIEPHHPDLYWYGVHGVEVLFTIMGPGCRSVARTHTKDYDVVVGVWEDGRIGTYRGSREGSAQFGALVYGSKGVERSGPYVGYEPLVEAIVAFFHSGKPPVPVEETLEIFAFMSAADVSKERGGAVVALDDVIKAAQAAQSEESTEEDRRKSP